MNKNIQVLIIGASASGVCAAIQAARMGAQVLLTEACPWVGGMLTAAGVSAIDGNNLLPSGLWGEFRQKLRDHYSGASALETGWVSNTHFEPGVAQHILREMIHQEKTITLQTQWNCIAISRTTQSTEVPRITGASFEDVDGIIHTITADITILADEFGDGIALGGLGWRTGLEGRSEYDESIGPEKALSHPQDLTWTATLKIEEPLTFKEESPLWVRQGEFASILGDKPLSWLEFISYGALPGGYAMLNWPIHGNDYTGDCLRWENREEICTRAQEKTLRLIKLLQENLVTGCITLAKNAYPAAYCSIPPGEDTVPSRVELKHPAAWCPPLVPGLALIPYIREARRVFGIQTLTLTDLTHPDSSPLTQFAVAVGDYPLDHHRDQDPDNPHSIFPAVHAFSVPYGALIPRDVDGIIVAEKSISVSGLVNGTTRLQPVVMQIGQAAGAAAALCISLGIQPRQLNVRILQSTLLDAHVYLAPTCDLSPDDPDFRQIQWTAVTGILSLERESHGWANRARIKPDEVMSSTEFTNAISRAQKKFRLPKHINSANNAPTRREVARTLYQWATHHTPKNQGELPWEPLTL